MSVLVLKNASADASRTEENGVSKQYTLAFSPTQQSQKVQVSS